LPAWRGFAEQEGMSGIPKADKRKSRAGKGNEKRGWAFRDGDHHSRDPVNGFHFLAEAYLASRADWSGRVTVPVLWDRETKRIVNNSEDDICRMLQGAFAAFHTRRADLFPEALAAAQDALSREICTLIRFDRSITGISNAMCAALSITRTSFVSCAIFTTGRASRRR
jgi:glutathionyl-hydroquinone reductase